MSLTKEDLRDIADIVAASEARMVARIDETDRKLSAKIDATDEKLAARIEQSEAATAGIINDLATSMDERFDAVDARHNRNYRRGIHSAPIRSQKPRTRHQKQKQVVTTDDLEKTRL